MAVVMMVMFAVKNAAASVMTVLSAVVAVRLSFAPCRRYALIYAKRNEHKKSYHNEHIGHCNISAAQKAVCKEVGNHKNKLKRKCRKQTKVYCIISVFQFFVKEKASAFVHNHNKNTFGNA